MNEQPSPEVLWRIEQAIVSDLKAVHPLGASHLTMIAVAIVLVVAVIGFEHNGPFALSVMTPVQIAGMFAAISCSLIVLARSMVSQMIPGSWHRIRPGLVPVVAVIPIVTAAAVMFPFGAENHFWIRNWSCIKLGMPLVFVAMAMLCSVLRKGAILSARIAGGTAGVLGGLAGTTALEVHCPDLHVAHILVSHVGVAVLGAVAGFMSGALIEVFRVTFPFRERSNR